MQNIRKTLAGFFYYAVVLTLVTAINGQTTRVALDNNEDFAPAKEPAIEESGETEIVPSLGSVMFKQTEPDLSARQMAPQVGTFLGEESESNNTAATANALTARESKIRGSIYPTSDVDFYRFTAAAGDRVYAATATAFSPTSSDTTLDVFASDGTTILESDLNDGTFSAASASIAGTVLPTAGTYYIRVTQVTGGSQIRPYDLYVTVRTGAPTAETEPNNNGTPQALPASNWVSGAINPATDSDTYNLTLNAGDTVFLSVNSDPERDAVQWNARTGLGLFLNNFLVINDTSGSAANPLSEAFFMTVKTAGTYSVYIDEPAAGGSATSTYDLSVSVFPAQTPIAGGTCTTYTNATAAPIADVALTSSTITVPGSPLIRTVRPIINLTHTKMVDLDVYLRSPAGNNNGIFTDVGSTTTQTAGAVTTFMDTTFDDSAAFTPVFFTIFSGLNLQPEFNYRFDWFSGENGGGVWTLDIRDDLAGDTGTLNSWGIEICTQPAPTGTLVYSTDFETNDGGYTHSGTQDEWEYGTPATAATSIVGGNSIAAFTTCNSGVNCWKTDLDNTYNLNSTQDLLSPPINLIVTTGTLNLSWAMRYQMENAAFDGAFVEMQDVNNAANNRVVWRWLGATMSETIGNPNVGIGESAGWGVYNAAISDFAGKTVVVRFHLDSDNSVNLGGLAVDDVQIRRVGPTAATGSVGGRVTNAFGRGISGATVTLTDETGAPRTARTNPFGYYAFSEVAAGQTYVLSAKHRQYQFAPRVLAVNEQFTDADLSAIY